MNNRKKDKNNNKTAYIFTRETMGTTLLLFSAIVLLMLFTGKAVFAGIGGAVCTFMYGTFGYGSLLLIALTAYLGFWLVTERRIKVTVKTALAVSLTVFSAFLLFHAATSRSVTLNSYGEYIKACYYNAQYGFSGYTFGGVISALIVYPFAKLTTFVGAYIIFSLFTIASGYFLFTVLRKKRAKPAEVVRAVEPEPEEREEEVVTVRRVEEPVVTEQERREPPRVVAERPAARVEEKVDDNPYSQKNLGRKILFEKGEFDAESYRRNMIFNENSYFNRPVRSDENYLNSFQTTKKPTSAPAQSYAESYQEDVLNQPVVATPTQYVYGEKPVAELEDFEQATEGTYPAPVEQTVKAEEQYSETIREEVKDPESREDYFGFNFDKPVEEVKPAVKAEEEKPEPPAPVVEPPKPARRETADEDDKPVHGDTVNMFKLFGASNTRGENRIEPDVSRLSSRRTERSKANIFDDDEEEENGGLRSLMRNTAPERNIEKAEVPELQERRKPEQEERITSAERITRKPQPITRQAEEVKAEEVKEDKPAHVWKKYVHPGLELLDDYPEHNNVNTGEIEDNKRTITETLAKFKIDCEVSNVIIGPAVTRYDVVIEDKTKVTQSLKYKEAIAMALMKDNVTAYLNYSKGALSIEVPNNVRTVVGLKSMLSSSKFINCKPNSVTFGLGKNVEGEVVCPDITKMPHLLVAGTTGSGKSICLSSLIISLLYKYGPEDLRFILVDPKQVEFISYDKLPHLMINEIIYDVDKAIKALNWAIKEMERRYSLFKDMTERGTATKNLDEYNSHLKEGEEKLPKIVIILDEFGDLMLQAKKDIEGRIIKLVQKARACGIHLILATQRPSVDCITGLIKSNLPTRIGFKVNSFDDARTIFDIGGAEKLLGKGDLYFRSAESPDLARIQGCFIDTHEVQRVTDFVKAHNETYFDQSVSDFINKVEAEDNGGPMSSDEGGAGDGGDTKIDDTYIKALYYCVSSNQASVSMIQRRFPVGYIKACKIIDWMENMNYVTQSEGSKPRKVLLSKEEFLNTYGEIDD